MTAGLILAVVIILWIFLRNPVNGSNLMLNPLGKQSVLSSASPTPSPAPTPKTFKFDKSTDLKKELETINPQVLESDFE